MNKEKKLGRGLEDFSHLFLSHKEKNSETESEKIEQKKNQYFADCKPAPAICITGYRKVIARSFLAVNLARQIVSMGKKVLLFDADFSLPRLCMLMKKHDNGSILKFISDGNVECRIGEFENGLNLITLDIDLDDHCYLSLNKIGALTKCFKKLELEADVLLVTFSPDINHQMNFDLIKASGNFVVLTPNHSKEMLNSYRVIKTISQINHNALIGIVTCRIEHEHQYKAVFEKMNDAASRHLNKSIKNYGYLPEDTEISLSIARGNPLSADTNASESLKCINQITKNILQRLKDIEMEVGKDEYQISFAEKFFSNSFIEHYE